MKKNIIEIFIVMLIMSSAMTTILFSDNGTVQASEAVNLDYDYVSKLIQRISRKRDILCELKWK